MPRSVKSPILIMLIILYVAIISYYFEHRVRIKNSIQAYVPELYSKSNPKITSVTIFHPKRSSGDSNTDEDLVLNKDFTYSPNQFTIDSTNELKSLDLACLPESFGYSIEQGNEIFPPYTYPKCSEVSEQNDTYLHIDRETNTLYMDCPEGSNNKIVVGPFDTRKLVLKDEAETKWKVLDYKGPMNATKIEFAVGSCDKDEDTLAQATTVPVFNKTAYEYAKNLTKGKPKLIFFLTLDSVSRRHFFRKLPRVVEFLNSLNSDKSSNFSVFDFQLHNTLSGNSPENQVPILGGNINFPGKPKGKQRKDFLGEKALWNILREKGYISMLGLESCSGNFIHALGRNPNVDYVVGPFFCSVVRFSDVAFAKQFLEQRCLGGHQTHYYLLNYTMNVIDMNPGVNAFLYAHLDTAHEGTGQHAATLNDDLTEYLESFIKKYQDDYELFIFLQGDHGMRFGNWYTKVEAYMEQRLPAFFLISSKSLLERFPYSYSALSANTQRLVSKMDLRETTLILEEIIEENSYSTNLLNKVVPKSRTCDDVEISPWDCSCLIMEEIPDPDPEITTLLENLKQYAQIVINSMSYSNPKHPLGVVCKRIELTNITKVYQTGVNNVQEIYRLEIESSTQANMKFQITYFLYSDAGTIYAINNEDYIIQTTVYMKTPIHARVRYM